MTKITEKFYCDLCGKENSIKPLGRINIDNGVSYPCKSFVQYEEVCKECCNRIINYIFKETGVEE